MSNLFRVGKEVEDLTGRKYVVVGIQDGAYDKLFRLRGEGNKETLMSAYEMRHYFRVAESK